MNKTLFNRRRIELIIKVFCCSVIIFVLCQVIYILFNLEVLTSGVSLEEIKLNNLHHLSEINNDQLQRIKVRRFRNFIMDASGSHPIYQGLWMSFVVYYNYLKLKFEQNSLIQVVLRLSIICLMLGWMILLSSRMPFIATCVAGFVTVFLFKHFKIKILVLSSLVFLVSFSIMFVAVKPLQTRYKELYESAFVFPGKGNNTINYNSTSVRSGIYYCSAMLAKDNWLFGLGVGDVQDNLSQCYDQKIGAKVYTWKKYNSHNQYMFFLLSVGVFGLVIFVLLLVFLIKKILFLKDSSFLYFLLITSIVFLTENLLSRSDGILFFSLFASLILISSNIGKNNNSIKA